MRKLARLCQGIAERLGWQSRGPRPDYLGALLDSLGALLDSGAGTLPETLAHIL